MALREGYNQMLRDNPVGNWFDSPPIGGGVPIVPAPLPEPRLPMPDQDTGYSPPWDVPVKEPYNPYAPEPMWTPEGYR